MIYQNGCGCCNNTPMCIPSNLDCGINVTLTASDYVARVCNTITYTVTVTNNSAETMTDAILTLPIANVLALLPNTITVNGAPYEDTTLNHVALGTINPNETVTVTYQTTIMACQRFIKHRAKVVFGCCQCFTKKMICVLSNENTVQVCCCCGNNN